MRLEITQNYFDKVFSYYYYCDKMKKLILALSLLWIPLAQAQTTTSVNF